jgi:hypothetical protein
MVELGSCSSGGVWRTAKRDSTGYCSSIVYCLAPASTRYCSFIIDFLQPPPTTVHLASAGYCSTSLHGVLFIHPNRLGVWRPHRGHVHPAATAYYHGVLFIQRQLPTHGRGPIHPTPTENCSFTANPTGSTHHVLTCSTYRACAVATGTVHPEVTQHTPAGYVSHTGLDRLQ